MSSVEEVFLSKMTDPVHQRFWEKKTNLYEYGKPVRRYEMVNLHNAIALNSHSILFIITEL